jgi:hypothetical protein
MFLSYKLPSYSGLKWQYVTSGSSYPLTRLHGVHSSPGSSMNLHTHVTNTPTSTCITVTWRRIRLKLLLWRRVKTVEGNGSGPSNKPAFACKTWGKSWKKDDRHSGRDYNRVPEKAKRIQCGPMHIKHTAGSEYNFVHFLAFHIMLGICVNVTVVARIV